LGRGPEAYQDGEQADYETHGDLQVQWGGKAIVAHRLGWTVRQTDQPFALFKRDEQVTC